MKILKWIGIVAGGLIALVVVAVLGLFMMGRSQINRTYDLNTAMVDVSNDEAKVARGEHLVTAVVACGDCHGENLEGDIFIDGPPIGRVVASNLTGGAGGIGGSYSDEDWVRALRHGLRPNGQTILPMMPSYHYTHLSDEDLGAIVAYLKTVPPQDNQLPPTELAFTGNIILGVFGANELPARLIDHDAARPARMEPAATTEYGAYLAEIGGCTSCHGSNLAGGQVDPSSPPGPNLTPGGELGDWSESDFVTLMRTGVTPAGRPITPFMPWPVYQNMSDEELQALWLYLQEREPLPSNLE